MPSQFIAEKSNLLSIGEAQSHSLLSINSSAKQIGHITPDGEVVVDAKESELVQLSIDSDFPYRAHAIFLLEIHKLRGALEELLSSYEDGGIQWCERAENQANQLLKRESGRD